MEFDLEQKNITAEMGCGCRNHVSNTTISAKGTLWQVFRGTKTIFVL